MGYGNDDFVPVILGTGLNAYNIARSLHVAYGVRSLALGRFAFRETQHSTIIDVRTSSAMASADGIVTTLQDLSAELGDRRVLLFATIEFYTNVLIARRDELGDRFIIPLVDADLAARLMDKTDFYRTCDELGIPHPVTRIVTPQAASDPDLGTDLPFAYPVICKPSDTDTYPRLSFEGKQKVYLVADPSELRAVVTRIYAAGYVGELVVQEYIPGDESVMRVANTYSDRNARMRVCSLGRSPSPSATRRWSATTTPSSRWPTPR